MHDPVSPLPPGRPDYIASGSRTSGYYLGEERLARMFVTPPPSSRPLPPSSVLRTASLNYNNAHGTVRSIRGLRLNRTATYQAKESTRERARERERCGNVIVVSIPLLLLLLPRASSRARDRRLMRLKCEDNQRVSQLTRAGGVESS